MQKNNVFKIPTFSENIKLEVHKVSPFWHKNVRKAVTRKYENRPTF